MIQRGRKVIVIALVTVFMVFGFGMALGQARATHLPIVYGESPGATIPPVESNQVTFPYSITYHTVYTPAAGATYILGEITNNHPTQNIGFIRIHATFRDEGGVVVEQDWTYAMSWRVAARGGTTPFRLIFRNLPAWSTYELALSRDEHPTRPPYPFRVDVAETYFDEDGFHVRGSVTNPTVEALRFAKVFVVMRDASGEMIGAWYGYTSPTLLQPSQTGAFDVAVDTWKGQPDQNVISSYEVWSHYD
ncbi:MAG: hypothetical protein KJZ93_31810 [Caldilineaceae bacterium]|nr:hypothetical protein [Caldilineaceae bacterium]